LKLRLTKGLTNALTLTATALCLSAAVLVASADAQTSHTPSTPIQHLIVIVGENHSYDNLFGAYQPSSGQKTQNLLYEGIIGADGSPGPNWAKAQQWQAQDTENYSITPQRRQPYASVPQPNTTFAFGQKPLVPDKRFPANLPNGPFPITNYTAYQLAYTGDPAHRFFQMWQQFDTGRNDLFTWVGVTLASAIMASHRRFRLRTEVRIRAR
jgi:phospholipase C